MSKKYYYTDAIVALYMMKEFGVKFKQLLYPDIHSVERELLGVSFESVHEEILLQKSVNDKIKFENRLIVAKESEHIFEPKKGDEGRWLRKIGAHYANHNGGQWVSAGIEPNPPEIIMRDNKQFFMPEVEND